MSRDPRIILNCKMQSITIKNNKKQEDFWINVNLKKILNKSKEEQWLNKRLSKIGNKDHI
jgi:hypothetical protein